MLEKHLPEAGVVFLSCRGQSSHSCCFWLFVSWCSQSGCCKHWLCPPQEKRKSQVTHPAGRWRGNPLWLSWPSAEGQWRICNEWRTSFNFLLTKEWGDPLSSTQRGGPWGRDQLSHMISCSNLLPSSVWWEWFFSEINTDLIFLLFFFNILCCPNGDSQPLTHQLWLKSQIREVLLSPPFAFFCPSFFFGQPSFFVCTPFLSYPLFFCVPLYFVPPFFCVPLFTSLLFFALFVASLSFVPPPFLSFFPFFAPLFL